MGFPWVCMYLLVACGSVATLGDGGPDADFINDAECKNPDKPYKCSKYAICYGFDSYCHSGDPVESCFPHEFSDNETAILNWCQQTENNVSKLLHPSCKFACVSKFGSSYLSLTSDKVTQPAVNTLTNSDDRDTKSCNCQDGGPDAEFINDAECKDPNKPHKCSRYAICYGFDSYCHSGDRVESCFPHEFSDNETAILNWCQQTEHNVSTLPHPSCKFACVSKFGSSYLSLTSDKATQPAVNTLTNSDDQDTKSCNCHGDHTESKFNIIQVIILVVVCIVLVVCILLASMAIKMWYVLRRKRHADATHNPAEARLPSEHGTGVVSPFLPPPENVVDLPKDNRERDKNVDKRPFEKTLSENSFTGINPRE